MTSNTMQCLICPGDRTVELTTKPIPEPGPDDVRIRVVASAICGSDLHKYRQPQAERDEHGYSKLTLGHEGAGVVDAVGPGVTYPAVGDRVVVYHLIGCGHCEHCRRGEPGFCREMQGFNWVRDGVNAEYVVVPARSTLPLPDDFDFEDGALLACNLGTGFAAARKARASGDMTLAVSGLGPVGLYTVMMARAMGASVIGIDVQPSRIEMAEKLGIDATANAMENDPVQAMRAFSGGDGVHAAIDTSGNTRARTAALEGLRPHGIFVEVGHRRGDRLQAERSAEQPRDHVDRLVDFQALRVGRPAGLHAAARVACQSGHLATLPDRRRGGGLQAGGFGHDRQDHVRVGLRAA